MDVLTATFISKPPLHIGRRNSRPAISRLCCVQPPPIERKGTARSPVKKMLALLQDAPPPNAQPGDKLSVFRVGECAEPDAKLAATHVLVRVHAAALNPIDVKRAGGHLEVQFPVIVGYDLAGVVTAVGDSVTAFRCGDRVFGDVMGDPLSAKTVGTVAEFAAVDAALLAPIPPHVAFTAAAAMPLVSMTALQMLRLGGAGPGTRLFVGAGAGGVAVHAMQIAKRHFGVVHIATTASNTKMALVRQYGADTVIDYRTQDAGEELAGWADVACDTTGEPELAKRIVRPGGEVVTIVGRYDGVPFCKMQPSAGDLQLVAEMLADGSLTPVIDSVYTLQEAMKALERQASGRASGKIIIQIRE